MGSGRCRYSPAKNPQTSPPAAATRMKAPRCRRTADATEPGPLPPAWNPAVMGGVPFAADPQSGWMYAPVMVLFTALPCDVAIRAMVVLQPILAGLGIYWFTRIEGLSRPAATVGGLALALMISAGELA